jgi:hypothetical protein
MSNVVGVVALVAGWYGLGYVVHRIVQKRKPAGLGLLVVLWRVGVFFVWCIAIWVLAFALLRGCMRAS